ncbi:chloride channel protein [Aquabacter sp. L1I39]|uniref:chloride channel protein n=1 Tax=Aquabacter sp. L1I39 TaxID=2820278 RepID=UPI001ADBA60E|nr:chloride channel protein [Aquabacter sp. L1I39]QTL02386.1 chloride channel protein [Aquabacter sp. L1I39]
MGRISRADLSPRRAVGAVGGAVHAMVRTREVFLVLLACIVGAVAGIGVTAMSRGAHEMHKILFGAGPEGFLSAMSDLSHLYMYAIPAAGGLVIGLYSLALKRLRPRPIVDPVEANALEGGRMSLLDSFLLSAQTMLCNGFGASVGMEAGYTQWGSGFGSFLGQKLRISRSEMRILVGCGAAAGIAAAFHAPLTGAFYAFELIIGVYAIPAVAQVIAAALVGFLVARELGAVGTPIIVPEARDVVPLDFLPYIALGLVGALLAIAIMRLMTLVEAGFARTGLPAPLRPVVGGMGVGLLALFSPQVLASGEGAMHIQVGTGVTLAVLGVLVFKIAAAALSLGSGFRGGLFSAALFMGSLLGKLFAVAIGVLVPFLAIDPVSSAVVGMAALAVGVVGGPFTMTFLTLESTGDLGISGLVLTAAIVCSLVVRNAFGFSFTTWRMHVRGETIRGAHDVGMIRSLTVRQVMEAEPAILSAAMPLQEARTILRDRGLLAAVLVDENGRQRGVLQRVDAWAEGVDPLGPAHALAKGEDEAIRPDSQVREALSAFRRADATRLPVADEDGRVVGLLAEVGALRSYVGVLERVRRSLSGDRY